MNIAPVSFASARVQNNSRMSTPSFGEKHFVGGTPKEHNNIKKTNLKDFMGTAKQYAKPFLTGVVLTFIAQTMNFDKKERELYQQIRYERNVANSGVQEMLKSIGEDIKDIDKVDSVEMKNVMGGFSKELILYKDGKRVIYDADEKCKYEDLGGDNYARTRFGIVQEKK